jgi:signal peptidase I
MPVLKGYMKAILAAATVALLIRFFVIEAYRIPTPAMRPTLEPGDVIFAIKPPFGLRWPGAEDPFIHGRAPRYGEVVVFSSGGGTSDSIRRIVGLPGDRVEVRKGQLILNGAAIEAAIDPSTGCGLEKHPKAVPYTICLEEPLMEDKEPETVPAGQVFVLGDLRKQLAHSQAAGASLKNSVMVPADQIKALAKWVWLSVDPVRSKLRSHRVFQSIH